MVKIWGFDSATGQPLSKDEIESMRECSDPDCKTCGGSGWIAICRVCDKPLAKHSYEQQQQCMKESEK